MSLKKLFLLTFLVLFLIPVSLQAQPDNMKPGLYAVSEGKCVLMNYSLGSVCVRSHGYLYTAITREEFRFKGVSSEVNASDVFVLVVDGDKKEYDRSFSQYDPFTKSLTPKKMMVLPLYVNQEEQRREYLTGDYIDGIGYDDDPCMDFEWDEVSDNRYEIRVLGLTPGEYGIIFSLPMTGYDFTRIFGFTIPDTKKAVK